MGGPCLLRGLCSVQQGQVLGLKKSLGKCLPEKHDVIVARNQRRPHEQRDRDDGQFHVNTPTIKITGA